MDSRLIYAAAKALIYKVDWSILAEDEWIYIGEDKDIKEEIILSHLKSFFKFDSFYIVLGRKNSKEINLKEYKEEIVKRISKSNFILCDKKFLFFVEFNEIGVMRAGNLQKI